MIYGHIRYGRAYLRVLSARLKYGTDADDTDTDDTDTEDTNTDDTERSAAYLHLRTVFERNDTVLVEV